MGDGVAEGLQFFVGRLQFDRAFGHPLFQFGVELPNFLLRQLGNLEEKLTRSMGEDNLVGSAGEFGLMFAFLANKPGAREVNGEPAVCLEDLRSMFLDKQFPKGWESWRKTRSDWVINTTSLMMSAGKAYLALQRTKEQA